MRALISHRFSWTLAGVAAMGVGGFAAQAQAVEFITNGSFEVDADNDGTPDGWDFSGGNDYVVSGSSSQVRTGEDSVSAEPGGTAAGNNVDLRQEDIDVSAIPTGTHFEGTVWYNSDTFESDTFVSLRFDVRNSTGGVIERFGSNKPTGPDPNSSGFSELESDFDLPSGASTIDAQVRTKDRENTVTDASDQIVYYDDVSLQTIPEPASLALLGVGGLVMLGGRRRKSG